MRRRSITKLVSMFPLRRTSDAEYRELYESSGAPFAPPGDTSHLWIEKHLHKQPGPQHVYRARDVEFYFGGVRFDLDAMSTIDISRREPSVPRFAEVTITMTQPRVPKDATVVMSVEAARKLGVPIPPPCEACEIGSDGTGALDPRHTCTPLP